MDTSKFVALKDISIDPYAIVAFARLTIPANLQTPEFYAIQVWLRDVKEPVAVTYEDIAERDADLELVKDSVRSI